jgi:hypothetical protein
MNERTLKEIASADGKWCALIVQRVDGNYTYRVLHDGRAGPDIGVYDTAETAEAEALSKMRQRMC